MSIGDLELERRAISQALQHVNVGPLSQSTLRDVSMRKLIRSGGASAHVLRAFYKLTISLVKISSLEAFIFRYVLSKSLASYSWLWKCVGYQQLRRNQRHWPLEDVRGL